MDTDDFWHFISPLGIKRAMQCQHGKGALIFLVALPVVCNIDNVYLLHSVL